MCLKVMGCLKMRGAENTVLINWGIYSHVLFNKDTGHMWRGPLITNSMFVILILYMY